MYRDTEQTYREFNLDVFEGEHGWQCDFWSRSDSHIKGSVSARRRKEVVRLAKEKIDAIRDKEPSDADN